MEVIVKFLSGATAEAQRKNRLRRLPWSRFSIGLEVGFPSVAPAMEVDTDLPFGPAVSTPGGGVQLAAGNCDRAMLLKVLIEVAVPIWAAVLAALPLLKELSQ